jgi:hypothetical protein
MSGMDPHMISENQGWVLVNSWLGFVEVGFFRPWVSHSEILRCDRGRYLLGDEFITCLLDWLRHRFYRCFL